MNWRIVRSLVGKDIKLFFRDKFFGIMTLMGLVMYTIFYFILPKTVDESIEIAVCAPQVSFFLTDEITHDGVRIHGIDTEDELKQAIMNRDYDVGIMIPEGIRAGSLPGGRPRVIVYCSAEVSEEVKEIYTTLLRELISEKSGATLNVETAEIVLGPDMGGRQIPHRKRMLPLLVFLLIVVETLGLANLITTEVETETVQALLTTPVKVTDLFVGKTITGVLLAFSPAVLLLVITGGLSSNALLIIVSLFLGATMITGLAFFIAAISKDMMTVVGWGAVSMIVLGIPAVVVIVPGPVSGWIKVIPSYFLVKTLHRASNFGIGWDGNVDNLVFLVAFNVILISLGIVTLKRKMA